jgi:hypothetical protein
VTKGGAICCRSQHHRVIKMNRFLDFTPGSSQERLIEAAYTGNDAEVALLLQTIDEIDLNTANASDEIALCTAVCHNKPSIVSQFIACKRATSLLQRAALLYTSPHSYIAIQS